MAGAGRPTIPQHPKRHRRYLRKLTGSLDARRLGSNLRDCPPFKSSFRKDLPPDQEREWMNHFELGTQLQETNYSAALDAYREAAKIDDSHALLNYRIARLEDRSSAGDPELCFRRALEEDVCPLRILPAQLMAIESLAKERDLQLVDGERAIMDASEDGLQGTTGTSIMSTQRSAGTRSSHAPLPI